MLPVTARLRITIVYTRSRSAFSLIAGYVCTFVLHAFALVVYTLRILVSVRLRVTILPLLTLRYVFVWLVAVVTRCVSLRVCLIDLPRATFTRCAHVCTLVVYLRSAFTFTHHVYVLLHTRLPTALRSFAD